ncbi:serine/threonine-protein kinase [Microbacterium invictum]|uniref:Protein kinase n=1 Tax=Microbacterium invictum TaxID=515415 RepID=A0ABZ0VE59_9MICO|nr:protein kinase [Microbacterium invictum]WQB71908.1 protein kinase [Microbacterium invictum]
MPPTPTPPEPLLDDRYRLGALIGEGGMARVYRADDVLLGRTVAVKLLRPGVEGSASPERARAEVAALAALSHPGLVMLLDARLEPGKPEYLVMEFVDGRTLAAALSSGPLPATEVAALAAELAEALHVVHAAGVVHRDLKPANILVTPSPLPHRLFRAKLADFGIAYLLDSARITTPGMVIGTASYLAPEQVRGDDPAPPADVYALGLVLIEALTGRRAFPASSAAEAALARLGGPPRIPDDIAPGWRALLARMTDLEPGSRPTALEVAVAAADLSGATPVEMPTAVLPPAMLPADPASGDEPTAVLAPAAPAARRPGSGRRRLPLLWGSVAAGAAVILALGTWAAVSAGTAEPAPAPAPTSTQPVTDEPADSPAPATTPTDPGVAPAVEQPAGPAPADEEAQREAEKAQRESEKEAEKAQREAEREAERGDDDEDG